ncbi:hypothetical protein NE865_09222 [Phthorimaea operculella]|nr:hypothetical protein NE865_09222 [Phthorimaea operculella]
MSSKVLALFCLIYCIGLIEATFIKPNNVPRVGRSNEAEGPFDQSAMGYVIKSLPSKNIPRMGRRNYDSGNNFDIPKFYSIPGENGVYGSNDDAGQLEAYYGNQYENMKK